MASPGSTPRNAPRSDLTAEEVREALHYDPDTGIFTWRVRPGWKWNKRLGGKRAGYANKGIGHRKSYRMIWFQNSPRKEHRLAWLYMTGQWPTDQIDHVNGDGLDNRWENLREATRAQNAANAKMYSTNSVGLKGVSPHKCGFQARIGVNGRVRALGVFPTAEEAHARYVEEAKKIYGEFARGGVVGEGESPNIALIPGSETRIQPLIAVVDGFPHATHKLETSTGGEPLENGRQVTDHAVARQAKLTLTGWVSDFKGAGRPRAAWEAIQRLHDSLTPIRVVTEWGTYPEMLIRRAEAPQRTRGMRFILELEELLRVGIIDTELPPEDLSGPAANRSGEVQRGRVALPPHHHSLSHDHPLWPHHPCGCGWPGDL